MSDGNKNETLQSRPSPAKNFIAGGFGGMCLVAAGHPFDTIKVRLQTASIIDAKAVSKHAPSALAYTGAYDCFKRTLVHEGIFGFYKGMGTPLVMVTPLFALSFWAYGVGKQVVASAAQYLDQGQKVIASPGGIAPASHLFCAGSISACFMTFVVAPVERIKCLLQVQTQPGASKSSAKYKGPVHCATSLLKEGGIPNLYRGFYATLLRGIFQNGLYFSTYEILKHKMSNGGELSVGKTLVAGGLTGIINWSFVLPLDVIKSRIQTAERDKYPKGLRDVVPQLVKTEGIKGLYRGIVPVFIRAFPANAACFLGFETAMKVMAFLGF